VRTYTIGETARRSGFTASALRYYEGIGLVAPAQRSGAGYRIYDDGTLERLGFISRAKQLGCSLEEITDLVGTWEGARCGPVQRRLHMLVTDKLRHARRRITELEAFSAQLQAVAARLGGPLVDGPCGEGCACMAVTPPDQEADLGVTSTGDGRPPIACSLEPDAVPGRIAEWKILLDRARSRSTTPDGGLRIEFDESVPLGALARLVVAERSCCAFFSFTISADDRGMALEVRTPEGAADIVTALFGRPA
jgi:DNA-binding transcriptional MerR regulator